MVYFDNYTIFLNYCPPLNYVIYIIEGGAIIQRYPLISRNIPPPPEPHPKSWAPLHSPDLGRVDTGGHWGGDNGKLMGAMVCNIPTALTTWLHRIRLLWRSGQARPGRDPLEKGGGPPNRDTYSRQPRMPALQQTKWLGPGVRGMPISHINDSGGDRIICITVPCANVSEEPEIHA